MLVAAVRFGDGGSRSFLAALAVAAVGGVVDVVVAVGGGGVVGC